MQFKLTFVAAALATLAVATPTPRGHGGSSSTCSTGPIQCCKSTQTAAAAYNDPVTNLVAGLLGINLQNVIGLVGSTCSPVNVAGGGTCSAQTVCCENNATGGLISVGCAPVTL
ncbi:fungal hydrophobin-domain-containing protein [Rhodocollybia butyracea]|uniref:Hydrophobin n=1 Tax=Rhodocollybia butyracea TaxID=206335 RepID=A0A9P5PF79_9AGAR|nr:fungal hydrophobin-domain-containing protein [Rhodocollybia butyracea]